MDEYLRSGEAGTPGTPGTPGSLASLANPSFTTLYHWLALLTQKKGPLQIKADARMPVQDSNHAKRMLIEWAWKYCNILSNAVDRDLFTCEAMEIARRDLDCGYLDMRSMQHAVYTKSTCSWGTSSICSVSQRNRLCVTRQHISHEPARSTARIRASDCLSRGTPAFTNATDDSRGGGGRDPHFAPGGGSKAQAHYALSIHG